MPCWRFARLIGIHVEAGNDPQAALFRIMIQVSRKQNRTGFRELQKQRLMAGRVTRREFDNNCSPVRRWVCIRTCLHRAVTRAGASRIQGTAAAPAGLAVGLMWWIPGILIAIGFLCSCTGTSAGSRLLPASHLSPAARTVSKCGASVSRCTTAVLTLSNPASLSMRRRSTSLKPSHTSA